MVRRDGAYADIAPVSTAWALPPPLRTSPVAAFHAVGRTPAICAAPSQQHASVTTT
jgi:hypothetical protein